MTSKQKCWDWQWGCFGSLFVGGAIALSGNLTLAQIVPDATLGAENSAITPNVSVGGLFPGERVDGGAVRGSNLFHSFQEFNILENQRVFFANPAGIQNILTRVTGSNRSRILGELGVEGTANLFLINPNGIIFGPNATLKINGSFAASTASSLRFADGTEFSATAPQTTPLLTISVPIGLQFGATPGSIRTQGSILGLPTVQTLALVGGDISLEGAFLIAGGRVELSSVAGNSLVTLKPTDKGVALEYEGVQNFQDIQLLRGASVDSGGLDRDGGEIRVRGRRVLLRDGSVLGATTFGSGAAGNVTVIASESLELIGTEASTGVQSSLLAEVVSQATGAGGNLTVETKRLIVRDGAVISAGTVSRGQGGTVSVNASESVEVIGTAPNGDPSGLFAASVGQESGNGGNLRITTGRLIVQDGAVVATSTLGQGQGGNLTVTASDLVEVIGTGANGSPSGLATETRGSGAAGELSIQTGRLIIRDGAVVTASTGSSGRGGTINVTALKSVEVSGISANGQIGSALFASSSDAGAAGSLRISTGELSVRDRAIVTVSGEGTGAAGDFQIQANSIRLDNGFLSATTAAGDRGNIIIQSQNLQLRRSSSIITNASGSANGGNITIDTGVVAALENSDIRANAIRGQGGNIQINTQGIFRSPDSDIDASSELGIDGAVTLNTPGIDPASGLLELPETPADPQQIAQGCPTDKSSRFTVTGRGGLPPNPGESLRTDGTVVNWVTLELEPEEQRNRGEISSLRTQNTATRKQATELRTEIVEAQGWIRGPNGEIILTASPPTATPYNSPSNPSGCYAP